MKLVLTFCSLILLAAHFATVKERETDTDSCNFNVEKNSVKTSVTEPDKFTSLVYIVEQPDSPLELVSVDLSDMKIWIIDDRYEWSNCARIRVRNRSERTIQRLSLDLEFNVGGGFGAVGHSALPSGQTTDIDACNGGGHGRPTPAPLKFLISVEKVEFAGCVYRPSMRIPHSLGVRSIW